MGDAVVLHISVCSFFFSSRSRHTGCALVTGVQTCALPIFNVALGGKVRDLPEMLTKAAAVGVAEMRIIRALAIRALALARLRAEVDGGAHPATVVSARSSGIFWKEQIGRAHV